MYDIFQIIHKYATNIIIGYTTNAINEKGIPNIQEKSSLNTEEQEKVEFISHTKLLTLSQNFNKYASYVKYAALKAEIKANTIIVFSLFIIIFCLKDYF